MRFCPVCDYCLFLKLGIAAKGEDRTALVTTVDLNCKKCGYTEPMKPKSTADALILETTTNISKKKMVSQLNEYTKLDPTLPHLKTIPCPNEECESNLDESLRDILYIKVDAKNMKYQYSCLVCETQWSS